MGIEMGVFVQCGDGDGDGMAIPGGCCPVASLPPPPTSIQAGATVRDCGRRAALRPCGRRATRWPCGS
uniref:Uncharacterized protein n=1 Tax=Leersia perrieri TaxID=77586 RepID=A0A0D9V0E0_9ORYZ